MRFNLLTAAIAMALFLAMVICQEVGRRFGRKRCSREGDKLAGVSDVDNAVFALLSLLIAFAYDAAGTRFDHRRDLVTDEVNKVGSAYQTLSLLPSAPRAAIQGQMREYLRTRIETYSVLPDVGAARAWLARSEQLQDEIWIAAVAAARAAGEGAVMVVLPAINDAFDAATTRTLAMFTHTPLMVFAMLAAVTLLSALLAGYGMGTFSARPVAHMLIYAGTLALAIFVILELEFPQIGWVRVDRTDATLVHLLERMK
jgi:cytochrome bd-type quinol oxidase subunit 2